MICFIGTNADAVWRQAIKSMNSIKVTQESRDQPTRELLHVSFSISDPRQRVVFARPINPAFAIVEVIWILAGANDTQFLWFWNPRMMQFTDDDKGILRGAYGYRLGSQPRLTDDLSHRLRDDTIKVNPDRIDQIKLALEALQHTPHSRQVVLQIWDSELDMPNPQPRSKDIPCNLMSHLLIRDGKLEWLQVMRSNDIIWGTPYNFIQFTTIQEIMAGWLGVGIGSYTHVSDSLHVYERHWEHLAEIEVTETNIPINEADLRIDSYQNWEELWGRLIDVAYALSEQKESTELIGVWEQSRDLPQAYQEWVAVLAAEALRRRGHITEAGLMIDKAGDYWKASWRQWAEDVNKRHSQD